MNKFFNIIIKLIIYNPGFLFITLINKFLNFFDEIVFISNGQKKMIKFNLDNWSKKTNETSNYVLIDSIKSPEIIIPYMYFSNILSDLKNAKIASFSDKKKQNFKKLRQSFNCNEHIYVNLTNSEDLINKKNIYESINKSIKNKDDVFNLKILDINCGIDIYETYLRRGFPTVQINDPILWEIIDRAIELCIFWTQFVKKNNVVAILPSHDVYIDYNIIIKVAHKNKIPVYMASLYNFQVSTGEHSLYKHRFVNYRNYFNNLSKYEKTQAIKISKKQISLRLGGKVGVDMNYSTKSSFNPKYLKHNNILKDNKKLKVLICTHCFYDNPHAYGSLLFIDFYEWIIYLGKLSKITDYDWYIKPHPDYLPGTISNIKKIIRNYPKIKLLNANISFHQLINEGLHTVLTCYGSVGHELAYLGINVVNAGLNPHINYNFNHHPSSIDEYKQTILNLKNTKISINKNEILEFYYIHYYYTNIDDLFFSSYKDFISKKISRNKIYKYFVEDISLKKHENIKKNILKFINSNKRNFFLKGPEN